MLNPAIKANSLTKHFPKSGRLTWREVLKGIKPPNRFTAIDGVTFAVPKGEVMGMLGRNGAGKSTLLRLLAGIYSPDAGSVALLGDVAGLFELGGIGNGQLTGRQFAARYMEVFGIARADRERTLRDIHEFSELGDYFDQKIHTYSAGMGARLYFSTATAIPHEIYLIDEVLSVGDEHFQIKSWSRMRDRLAKGASGVLVTHDWSAVIKLCRTSGVLESGRMKMEGRSDEIVAAYLDLEQPAADRARFDIAGDAIFKGVQGQDFIMAFDVELLADGEVEAAVSIETLALGVGWEPVILTEYAYLASSKGRYRCEVTIDRLPLSPGDYLLNLSLASPVDAVTGRREALDARGWTYGSGLTLRVAGQQGLGVAPFAMQWAQEAQQ